MRKYWKHCLKRGNIEFLNPKKMHKNLGMVTMGCSSKRAFENDFAREILRPRAKVTHVLQNIV
jgi:hypothetical protein